MDEFDSIQSKEGVLIIIDCTQTMWEPQKDGSVPVTESLKAALHMYKSKALESPQDEIGLMLFGVPKMHPGGQQHHIFVVHPLQQVDVDMVKDLQQLIDALSQSKVEAYRTPLWQKKFGDGKAVTYEQVKLALVFSEATVQTLFRVVLDEIDMSQIRRQQRKGVKRVLLFTNVDDPHSNDMQLLRAAIQRGGDLVAEKFVTLELLAINKNGKPFDVDVVYKSILVTQTEKAKLNEDEVYNSVQIFTSATELSQSATRRLVAKRSLASIPFSITSKLTVGVKVYHLFMEAKVKSAGKVSSETYEEVAVQTEYRTGDNQPYRLVYGQQYGGKTVQWSAEERAKIHNPLPNSNGLVLLGFKPRQYLKNDYNYKQSAFLYPDNKQYDGSVTVLSAMIRKMIEMDQIAVVQFQPRRGFQPTLAALLPQAEVKNEYGYQDKPAGFVTVSLPFADYFRDIPVVFQDPVASVEDEVNLRRCIGNVIKCSMLSQLPAFSNPNLQTHYALIESLALQSKEGPRPVVDQTQPAPELFAECHQDLQILTEAFAGELVQEDQHKKTKHNGDNEEREPKKQKVTHNVVELYNEGKLTKCTVAELKDYLKVAKLNPGTKKKAELIEMVEQHIQSKIR